MNNLKSNEYTSVRCNGNKDKCDFQRKQIANCLSKLVQKDIIKGYDFRTICDERDLKDNCLEDDHIAHIMGLPIVRLPFIYGIITYSPRDINDEGFIELEKLLDLKRIEEH